MNGPALRDALGSARVRVRTRALARDTIIDDYVRRYGAVPAISRSRPEPAVIYSAMDSPIRLLLGAYGDIETVRGWLPGLPGRVTPETMQAVLAAAEAPVSVTGPPCQQVVVEPDLDTLPIPRATSRDAGPYLTMGLVHASNPDTGDEALSVHRMLVLDRKRLTIWMVPGRQLRAMYAAAVQKGSVLPVSVNIGAPPAAMVASALNTRFLPGHGAKVSKLQVAGALAAAPVVRAPALTQPVEVLADSEIVIEGYLGAETADETLGDVLGRSLPEFLGYDGNGQADLPVLTVTAVTTRYDPMFQAVAGPGREQSIILGLAGAMSVALSVCSPIISDIHFPLAGGGMLVAVIAVAEGRSPLLPDLAAEIFRLHPFVKLVIFVDDDVDASCAEDVLWAVITRANLGADVHALAGFAPLGMDPSQRPQWAQACGQPHPQRRTFIDATIPSTLRAHTARSFSR